MDRDLWYIFHKDGYIVEVDKLLVSDIDEHIKFLNSRGAVYRVANEDEINEHLQMQAEKSAAIKLANDAAPPREATYTIGDDAYVIPLTGTDANGVSAITIAFSSGAIQNTVFFATNGVKVPLDKDTYEMFSNWFWEQRNKQFTTYNKE